jgi:bifunctional non-homologous end joining protein LigD
VSERTTVQVGGRKLSVSNLDKVYWPATSTTKAELLRYVAAIAPAMLPHLAHRPVTLKRYPEGVDGQSFFEKRCPSHRPDWLGTTWLPKRGPGTSGSRDEVIEHCDLADVAAMVWAANLGALELHVPMARAPDPTIPRAVVFDLDPGAPADVVTCGEVALHLKEVFDRLSLTAVAKTSGGKGLQLYVPLNRDGVSYDDTRDFSREIAQLLERVHPELVVSTQTKTERVGKVLIDWYQNHLTKTTVCVYSPRARERPTVSTPVTWDEVDDAVRRQDAALLRFELDEVLDRVQQLGDLFAPVAELEQDLPKLR